MSEVKTYGVNFFEVLLILFITLKLTGVIAWSWWWVLSPLWIPAGVVVLILIIIAIAAAI